jgi:nitrogenase-associated protein
MVIEFYEKPGCGGNARQKEKLSSLGCMLVVKDLLNTKWSAEELRSFFADKPKNEWFNMSAPIIKDGFLNPVTLTEEQALEAMLKEPILIKRPLLKSGDVRISGFDPVEIKEKLGLNIGEAPATCTATDACHQVL